MSYHTNEFCSGIKIIQDNEPCIIINNEFVKPGKGQAFNRVRLRKLISGKILEKVFKSGDIVEAANVIDINLIFLYYYNELWYFMNNKNYEQLSANINAIGDNAKWLIEQTECIITLWNDQPIIVMPPTFIISTIADTNPNSQGDTVTTSNKFATLSTGAIIKVPSFIQKGDIVKVDTRSGIYVARIK